MSNDANKLKKRQEIRKYPVYAGMFLLFIGCMWWIFTPSKEDRQEEARKAGFNTELPDPRGAGIEGDKIAAYEQADMRRRQEEKMRTLEDFSSLADGKKQENQQAVEIVPDSEYQGANPYGNRNSNGRDGSIASSTSAYNDINATLGNFYESPQEDPEKEALKAEVEQLKQAVATQNAQPGYEEQVALLEKSYELAARYMPGNGGVNTDSHSDNESPGRNGKAKAVPVGLVSTPVVSSLPQPVSDRSGTFSGSSGGNGAAHLSGVSGGTGHPGLHPRGPDRHQRSGSEDETAGADACREAYPAQKLPAYRRRAYTG